MDDRKAALREIKMQCSHRFHYIGLIMLCYLQSPFTCINSNRHSLIWKFYLIHEEILSTLTLELGPGYCNLFLFLCRNKRKWSPLWREHKVRATHCTFPLFPVYCILYYGMLPFFFFLTSFLYFWWHLQFVYPPSFKTWL